MERLTGALVGAFLGLGFGVMGLVDARNGFELAGASENSYVVAALVAAVGAVVGALWFAGYPSVLAWATAGLALGIWLRDNAGDIGPVQPPQVFLLLFGLPILGGWLGWALSRRGVEGGKA